MWYSTATVPVNPERETRLARSQVWAGLELKARDAVNPLPSGFAPAAMSWKVRLTTTPGQSTVVYVAVVVACMSLPSTGSLSATRPTTG
jgi:hypothetical protein